MKEHQELKTKIKTLIAANKIEEAIELLATAQFSALDKELIILNSQYNRVLEEARLNLISKEEADRRLNNVTMALIKISDKIGANKSVLDGAIPGNKLSQAQKALLILIPVLAIIGLVLYFFPKDKPIVKTDDGNPTKTDSIVELTLPESLSAEFLFSGNANDSKGYLHGTRQGAVLAKDRKGQTNSAYFFDGKGARIDFSPLIDTSSDKYSIAFWLKSETNDGTIFEQLYLKKGQMGFSKIETCYGVSLKKSVLSLVESSLTDNRISSTPIPKDVWTHIVFIRDNNKLELFVNGKSNSTATLQPDSNTHPKIAEKAVVGAYIDLTKPAFKGCIDDLYIFKDAIGPETVQKLFLDK